MILGGSLSLSAFAREFSYEYQGQTLTYTVIDEATKSVEIKGGEYGVPGNTVSGDLIIPETVSDGTTDYTVTTIGEFAFLKSSEMTSVYIPASVTEIREQAFTDCDGLTRAEFANIESLCSINFGFRNSNPLYYAHNLYLNGEAVAPDLEIPATINRIGGFAFCGFSGMNSVTIPNSITEIGRDAFYMCSGLTRAEFESLESLCAINFESRGSNPLYYTHKLYINGEIFTSDIEIPATVNRIGSYAFCGLTMSSVSIPNSITEIGKEAFSDCNGLIRAEFASIESLCSIKFESEKANPLSLANNLYIDGVSVTSVEVPASINQIGDYTFSGFTGLTSVTIPNSITQIGNGAFYNCSGLTELTLPNSITEIGKFTFYNCKGLTEVTLPNSITEIGEYAFSLCEGLTELIIPGSVVKIGRQAFYFCGSLTSVSIPNSVQEIGENAFGYCFKLTRAEYQSIESLCSISFGNDSSNPLSLAKNLYINGELVTAVEIPATFTRIGAYTFYNCTSISSLIIPNSITEIDNYALYGCSGLTELNIPNSVTKIGDYAFFSLKGLTELTIPNSVTEIGTGGFLYCSGLTRITLPNSITEISPMLLSYCSALTSVTIPNTVTTIGLRSFAFCSSLTDIVIPPSVEIINNMAFISDNNLSSVIMGYNVKSIGEIAFNYCPITSLSITAQTPPNTSEEPFSNFSGTLYLQGQDAITAYSNAGSPWNQFSSMQTLIEPTGFEYNGNTTISGKSGDTFQLTASIMPENVSLPHLFWSSTDPSVATVDNNGLVTIMADSESATSCKIIAETLYAGGPTLEIEISASVSGLVSTFTDSSKGRINFNEAVEIYNLSGIRVADGIDGLSSGIYIIRQGAKSQKYVVK